MNDRDVCYQLLAYDFNTIYGFPLYKGQFFIGEKIENWMVLYNAYFNNMYACDNPMIFANKHGWNALTAFIFEELNL